MQRQWGCHFKRIYSGSLLVFFRVSVGYIQFFFRVLVGWWRRNWRTDLHDWLKPGNQITCGDNLGEAPKKEKGKKKELFDQAIPFNDSQGMALRATTLSQYANLHYECQVQFEIKQVFRTPPFTIHPLIFMNSEGLILK